MTDQETDKAESPNPGILGTIGRSIAEGARNSLRWAAVGAIIGALLLGGLGGYYFGWSGLGVGLLAGAVIGALVFWWLFMTEI